MTLKNLEQITIMILATLQEFYEALIPNTTILGVDFGVKKVGFAISDHAFTMALPLNVIKAEKLDVKLKHIMEIVQKYRASGIVVGLPLNMDGTYSDQTKLVVRFAEKLAAFSNLPIFLQDERLTSMEAQSILRDAGFKRKDRDKMDDKIAASLILNTVINSLKSFS